MFLLPLFFAYTGLRTGPAARFRVVAFLAETTQCSLLIVHPNPRAPVVETEAVMEPPADAEAMVGA